MNQGGELVIALIFSELDTNQDGFINKDEARDFIMKSNNSSDAKDTALKLIDPIFELLDTDKDGKISVQELITAFTTDLITRKLFDEADTDKDGYLVKDEVRNFITKLDFISPEDKENILSELDAKFGEADSDKDGKVSLEELKAIMGLNN